MEWEGATEAGTEHSIRAELALMEKTVQESAEEERGLERAHYDAHAKTVEDKKDLEEVKRKLERHLAEAKRKLEGGEAGVTRRRRLE